jgi:hypothetical protein
MSRPRKIVVEFEDGSKVEAAFGSLTRTAQQEMMRQPFLNRPNPSPEKGHFVLLEWDDGWKEVIQVKKSCEAIKRYYVIRREEDVGRLSIDSADGYPELIEVRRKPMNLRRVVYKNAFDLKPGKSTREGKKTDLFFDLTNAGDAFEGLAELLREAVGQEEIGMETLWDLDSDGASGRYERIRRKMGIKAGVRQQDVLDFIRYLAGMPSEKKGI